MGLFISSLTSLFQLHVKLMSVFAMDTVVRLIVICSDEPYPETFSLTDLPSASGIDVLMVTM